jgi:hypothetical protein
MRPHSRDTEAPELLPNAFPHTEGAGNAGCPLHPQPRVQKLEAHERSRHRYTGATRHSLRDGFNGLFRALPGERIRLVTVVGGLRCCQSRSGRLRLRQLDTSNGCQDHTALPSATSVARPRALVIAHGLDPPCDHLCAPDAAASTASHPASVTIAIRPSGGRDGTALKMFLPGGKAKNICEQGWTLITGQPGGQISRRVRYHHGRCSSYKVIPSTLTFGHPDFRCLNVA